VLGRGLADAVKMMEGAGILQPKEDAEEVAVQ
jgi:hypothetical protein